MLNLSTTGPAVGAGIALAGLVLGKESKTSEFRQARINGLQNDVATLISLSFVVTGPADSPKLDRVKLIDEAACRVRLRFAFDEAFLESQSTLTTAANWGYEYEF